MRLSDLMRMIIGQLRQRKESLDPNTVAVMLNRSWFFGVVYLLFYLITMLVGADVISYHPPCEPGQYDNCVGRYNHEILDATQDVARIACYTFLAIDLIFVIACYKWRWLA